jgi:hypothetical protein
MVDRSDLDIFNTIISLKPYGVTNTSGNWVSKGETAREFQAPNWDLVDGLLEVLRKKMPKITSRLPEARILKEVLVSFRIKITAAGNDTYSEWRHQEYDDR